MNFQTRLAASCLKTGGVISNPTDTIQGLTCLPKFKLSMARVLQLKRRSSAKGLILLASDVRYFIDYVEDASLLVDVTIDAQPTTYLLKANEHTSKLLTGDFDTIALRLTNNQLITNLCVATNGALVSSSANITSKRSATSMLDLKEFFSDKLDFIIPPKTYNTQASKIINLQTGEKIR
ncbi:tRNA threonylcarbamoyladenosine biosynthesis protein [Abyssogena phaseoliformis symbiont OG214]|uniref:L-threonylcarbamoyladenylate synthase n=1 Tax=Abyssogena phaseoliformis symbiont TaxID=596095 RepID=UPI001916A098|nr:Sua5/YciO/YrdC/YwlC family protein [Abyssogena phaseoliformis symbiont]MBW5289208.1 TsaC protein (YrdC domain) required for threonylcarbamoyladenosine t(6)A37 modification in tRNA [Candidatus Ruthia sp. Apha_13_S6]BBB22763.1 tRNA threonylcarbamoyladenosine biosynthesis protein [Abyssogena phaseoliformis symbiont OG214]